MAQNVEGDDLDARKDAGSHPIKAGSFLLFPKLTLEQQYDDNIFSSQADPQSDFITLAAPSLIVQKSVRDHTFTWENKAEAIRFRENDTENIENYFSGFSGRIVARRSLALPFHISYDIDHKQRRKERTPDRTQAPSKFKTFSMDMGAEYKPNRLGFALYGYYDRRRHENGLSGAGATIVRDDADADSLSVKGVVSYHSSTDWAPFISLQVSENSFLRAGFTATGYNGIRRDNRVVRALGGVKFNYHDLLIGSAALGQDWRTYKSDAVADIAAASAEGDLTWKPRQGTEFKLGFLRRSDEDNIVNNGTVETNVNLGLDYELKKDLYFRALAEWENTQFEVTKREDDIYGGSAGLYYILNSRFQVEGNYLRRWRESSQAGSNFNENVFLLRLITNL